MKIIEPEEFQEFTHFYCIFFQIIKMMIVVVVIYTFCWLPLHIITIAGDINKTFYNLPGMNIVWTASHWLAMSNSMYNPFIYCWMNAKFRNGFRQALRCCSVRNSGTELEMQRMHKSQNGRHSVRSTLKSFNNRHSTEPEYTYIHDANSCNGNSGNNNSPRSSSNTGSC